MIRKAVAIAAVLALTAPVMAGGVWNEDGDAPELLPGQEVVGNGDLAEIIGTFGVDTDVDLYQILIKDADTFSASTVDRCDCDTQLFLFDGDGNGVTHDDDAEGRQDLLSTITDQFVSTEGVYYLAVTQYNNDPLSPDDDLIWANQPFREERQPDGPGAPGPLFSWSDSTIGNDNVSYSIGLSGASFVPEPSSIGLLGIGLFALMRRRK